jgi:NAD(P)-dependent dehydrogenase (short-subunit alcohol dehydrogenase family)
VKSYSGKTVYITGGSSGIGLAAAKQFAGAGANVAIFSRDQKKLDAALPLIQAKGHDRNPPGISDRVPSRPAAGYR